MIFTVEGVPIVVLVAGEANANPDLDPDLDPDSKPNPEYYWEQSLRVLCRVLGDITPSLMDHEGKGGE